jgi:hypothetical protein
MPQKKQVGAGCAGEREKTFLEYLLQTLLDPYGGESPPIADRQRLVDILALNSEYIRRSGADVNYAARDKIASLCVALSDLNDGVPHPIFQAKRLEHGKRLNSIIWRSRTTVAIALDYLIKANVSEAVALKQVANIPGIEKLLSGKNPSKQKSPKNWRVLLDSGQFPTDLVREQWGYSREFIAKMTGSPTEKRKIFKAEAERLIAAAAQEIKQI